MSSAEKITFFDASSEKTFEELLTTPKSKKLHQELLAEGFKPLGVLGETNEGDTIYNLIYQPQETIPKWVGATLLTSAEHGKPTDAIYLTSDFKNKGTVITVSGTANWFEDPRYFHCGLLGISTKELIQVHLKMSELYQTRFDTEAEVIHGMDEVIQRNNYYFQEELDKVLEKKHQDYLKQNKDFFNIRFTVCSFTLMLFLIGLNSLLSNQTSQSYLIPFFVLWIAIYYVAKKTSPYWKRSILTRRCQKRFKNLKI